MGRVEAAGGRHVRETGRAVSGVVMMMVSGEIGVAGRRGSAGRDGGCARVADGARKRGERRVLLMRVVRMLMSTLWPSG